MGQSLTPGLYVQAARPALRAGLLVRGDVTVMPGYAARGPVMVPVRLQSLSQFEEVFGGPLAQGYLWFGAKGFFECGGRVLYVVRITDGTARAASVTLGNGWTAQASFPWSAVDPRRSDAADRADSAVWRIRLEEEIRKGGPRRTDPGGWANGLAVEFRRVARAETETLPEIMDGGSMSRLAGIAGVEVASVFELTQFVGGTTRIAQRNAIAFDPVARSLTWDAPLSVDGFDPARPIRITTVEFDVTIWRDGRNIENFAALSPADGHSTALIAVTEQSCRNLHLTRPAVDPSHPDNWPPEGVHNLSGGTEGLTGLSGTHWQQALAQIRTLDDAALIAAPDLALQATLQAPPAAPVLLANDCADLSLPENGHLTGLVEGIDETGSVFPLPDVSVDVAGRGGNTKTDGSGYYALDGLPMELATLRLFHPDYQPVEVLAQPSAFQMAPGEPVQMSRFTLPATLPRTTMLQLQKDMGNPAIVGPYKIAIIAARDPQADVQTLRSWAAELGPEPRLGLFAPWLRVSDQSADDGQRIVPPGGHICGLFARAALMEGVHRSGANMPLSYCEGVTVTLDDTEQGLLNSEGINALAVKPGRGVRANGTRSRALATPWQYLTSRRIVDALEKTLEATLKQVVFEPNAPHLRQVVTAMAVGLLENAHRKGLLAGAKPQQAFSVKCDDENNPQDQTDRGQLVLDIAVAPTIPAEFVIFRISHAFDALSITENR